MRSFDIYIITHLHTFIQINENSSSHVVIRLHFGFGIGLIGTLASFPGQFTFHGVFNRYSQVFKSNCLIMRTSYYYVQRVCVQKRCVRK